MKVKQNIISFLLGALLMFPVGGYAANLIVQAVDVPVLVDGQAIDTTVYNINDKNYTSARDIAEAMGGTVEWKDGKVQIETPKTDIEKVTEACKDSCVMVYVYKGNTAIGSGSGFIYNGYVITAKHVTDAGDRYVVFRDDSVGGITATLKALETDRDVSALSIKVDMPPVTLGDSDKLKEGQKVIAITSPSSVQNAVDECFYHGMVYTGGKDHLGISDSNLNQGSSGGAIFDAEGNLIGIITRAVNGNGAAIPVNEIKPILEQLK